MHELSNIGHRISDMSLSVGSTTHLDKLRDFIQKATSGSKVLGAPVEINRLRERKSKEEIEILKCVNEVRFST